jgi:hypothetical protein
MPVAGAEHEALAAARRQRAARGAAPRGWPPTIGLGHDEHDGPAAQALRIALGRSTGEAAT